MSTKNSIRAEELTSIASADLTGGYDAINADGLSRACTIIRLTNDMDVDVQISYDGIVSHDYLKTGDWLEVNAGWVFHNNQGGQFKKGTIVYALGTAGQDGSLYLAGYSQQD